MQSFYALCAVGILMVLGLSMQRHYMRSQQDMVSSEVETVALGVATGMLNQAAALPFDRTERVAAAAQLTPPAEFGGAPSWELAQDLDDLHRLRAPMTVESMGSELTYETSVSVRYVARTGSGFAPSAAQSPFKEVTVTVSRPGEGTLTLSRVYGYLFGS